MTAKVPNLPIKELESRDCNELLETIKKPDGINFQITKKPKNRRCHWNEDGDKYSQSVDLLLNDMGMGKYVPIFKKEDIGINILVQLNADDLTNLGITNVEDRECILKHLRDFDEMNKNEDSKYESIYKIEDDLLMAYNVYIHLAELNSHISFIQFVIARKTFEDYFVTPKQTVLDILKLVTKRALTQSNRISKILCTGNFKDDDLICTSLKADKLELPEYLKMRLIDLNRGTTKVGRKGVLVVVTAIFTLGILLSTGFLKKIK